MPESNTSHPKGLPVWHYDAPTASQHQRLPGETPFTLPPLDGPNAIDMGTYTRHQVTNLRNPTGRRYFDLALRLMLSYQHEMAAKYLLVCLKFSPYCALAHGLVAICHSPNYNFKGEAYYNSASHVDEVGQPDELCLFPSEQVADRHSRMAVEKMEAIKKMHRGTKKKKGGKGGKMKHSHAGQSYGDGNSNDQPVPDIISDVEAQLLNAIRILTGCPGIEAGLAEEMVGRPYADAMREVHQNFPEDPEIAYCFVESLMVLNAWQLYEYPSGKPVARDVVETRDILERTLKHHPTHPGLCHMYVHLSEMSAHPELALEYCEPLRSQCPNAGHLIHMPTHIDVLVGDYEACIKSNVDAILADRHMMDVSPSTAGRESFYFGYIVHNFHMAVYGALLGGMEQTALRLADELNSIIDEATFAEFPMLASYLESYSALDIHTMVRFGRWKELLEVPLPKNKHLMLYRTACVHYARGLALAIHEDKNNEAMKEVERFDTYRYDPEAKERILHNNSVADLLAVDSVVMRGEIAYRQGNYEEAFTLLRKAVELQDNLNYDEPWGKMQPVRHSLGGLLFEQGFVEEATKLFREDLKLHPKNPWSLLGLIRCLKSTSGCCDSEEVADLERQLREQQSGKLVDFKVVVPCACCQTPAEN